MSEINFTMKKTNLLAVLLTILVTQVGFATPIFIAQAPQKEADKFVPDLASAVAEVSPEILSLTPMVWSLTDPSYRDAYYSGKFTHDPSKINLKDAIEAAKNLESPFLIWLVVDVTDNGIKANVQLYDSGTGRKNFDKTYQIGAESGGSSDILTAVASTARLALFQMCEKQLKPWKVPLSSGTQTQTDQNTGSEITPIETTLTPLENPDDEAKLLALIDTKIKSNEIDFALLLLYDAIDIRPNATALRQKLISLLSQSGSYLQLIEECRNCLLIDPTATPVRIELVKALLLTGDTASAQTEMNELLARDQGNPLTTVLQGDFFLEKGEISKARTMYLIARQKLPLIQVDLAILTATALEGDTKETDFLLKNIDTSLISDNDVLMKWIGRYSRQGVERTCSGLQAIIRNIRVTRLNSELTRGSASLTRISDCLIKLNKSFEPKNPTLKNMHEHRVLAYNLLAQASKLVEEAINGRDEEKCSDAELLIGDCLSLIRNIE